MIFKFLRQYFLDDEFEQNKSQLEESQRLLGEYKAFIEKEKDNSTSDKEKIDPDFLTLIWASIGVALAIFLDSGKAFLELDRNTSPTDFWVYVTITLLAFIFVVYNSMFALDITKKYAQSKSDSGYLGYAWSLIIGAVVLTVSVFVLAYF